MQRVRRALRRSRSLPAGSRGAAASWRVNNVAGVTVWVYGYGQHGQLCFFPAHLIERIDYES